MNDAISQCSELGSSGGLQAQTKIATAGAGNAVTVVVCVRNEMLRLPFFFEYYRRLGAGHFIIIDNASSDDTLDYLLSQDDVSVYFTSDSYAESHCGVHWLNAVLDQHLDNQWALVVDADELLCFPCSENVALPELCGFLQRSGADALVAPMLDMYAESALNNVPYQAGEDFRDWCPYFDSDSYQYIDLKAVGRVIHRGGVRERMFWRNNAAHRGKPPVLQKYPLFRWSANRKLEASTHVLRGATISSTTGLLLHFKFLGNFAAIAHEEVRRAEHWDGAAQYEAYADVLSDTPSLMPFYSGSRRLIDSHQLVDMNLMHLSAEFHDWVYSTGKSSV